MLLTLQSETGSRFSGHFIVCSGYTDKTLLEKQLEIILNWYLRKQQLFASYQQDQR